MKKSYLIVNPNARKHKKNKGVLIDKFKKVSSGLVEIVLTESLDELNKFTKKITSEDVGDILISGGDGTIHQVISSLIKSYKTKKIPNILLLNDGTMNNIARSIKLSGNSVSILKRYLNKIEKKDSFEKIKIDILKINKHYCCLFGFGLTTNFLREAYAGDKKGVVTNIKVIFKGLKEAVMLTFKFKKFTPVLFNKISGKIKIDNNIIPFENIMNVIGGTVEQIGMGFSPLYNAKSKDGTFHVLITGNMKPLKLFKSILKLKKGKEIKDKEHFDIVGAKFEITADTPFQFTMDGDMYDCDGRLKITAERQVEFLKI